MPLEINNFATGASTTDADSTVFNASPADPYLTKTGVGTDDVTLSDLGKYAIDIFGDIRSYNPKNTPMLNILASLGSESMSAPVCTWIDEYEGDAWVDIKLDDLRESTRNSGSYYNGRLTWDAVTTKPSDGVDCTMGSNSAEIALATGNILEVGFDVSDDYIRGKKVEVIRKIANTLAVMDYEESTIDGSTETWYRYQYSSGTSRRVHMAFDDLAFACGASATYYQKHEVVVGVEDFYFEDDYSQFIIRLDFDESNIVELLDATASNNTFLLDEISPADETVFDASHEDYYTRFARYLLIGNYYDVPAAIAEGSNYEEGGNFIFGQDEYMNYAQIFQSKKYGITGTRQATKLRFTDDWPKTRARHLQIYKKDITSAMMFGVQSITYDSTTGYPERTMSGFFDYGTFPIRYMKNPIPAIASDTQVGSRFRSWLEDITYSLNAYRQDGGDAHTVFVSQSVLKSLADWNAYIGTSSGNVVGSVFETVPPSTMTMGLEVFEFKCRYGTLRFVEEPALNYMPKFPYSVNSGTAGSNQGGAPVHLFSSGLNPRNMMLAVDKAHANFLTLRPDKIEGNIQAIGQDMFQEAIRGEHSFKLRFPRNHAIIDVS